MPVVLKRILCFFISFCIVLLCIIGCCIVCNHPSEEIENTVSSFYREPENSLDIVMIGSSASNKDFQPAVIWQRAGITSYSFSVGACSANIYASMLEEVISKQPDALILVDIDGFVVDDKYQEEIEPVRLWADSMPKNENHKNIINKYFKDTKLERYFPFIRYHRYMTSLFAYIPTTVRLLKKEIGDVKDPLGGATLNDKTAAGVKEFSYTRTEKTELSELSGQVFDDFISFCKENGLKNVMFVNLPKSYNNTDSYNRNKLYVERTNKISEAVKQLGYAVYDYNSMKNPAKLDFETDFADTLHLSTDGAIKFSEYFADYLSEKYSFNEKSDEIKESWNARVDVANRILGR